MTLPDAPPLLSDAQKLIEPQPNYKIVLLQILFSALGSVFAAPAILIGIIEGPLAFLHFAFSGLGPFSFFFGLLALAVGFFFQVALLSAGSGLVAEPFRIDAVSGETTDARDRHWNRDRHGPAKVTLSRAGPAAIIFPAFDGGRPADRMRRPGFLRRGFAWLFLGARESEVDGLILPIQFLTDRDAIMAAVKPERPPFRWF